MANNKNASHQKAIIFNVHGASCRERKIYDIVAGKDGDRFITSIVTAVGTNPELSKCDYSPSYRLPC